MPTRQERSHRVKKSQCCTRVVLSNLRQVFVYILTCPWRERNAAEVLALTECVFAPTTHQPLKKICGAVTHPT
ncbi:hypothetical protein [Microseira sp. BLCC-F43]|uniref:hypothetical protein n=1 Tax=Microseira sp. BLCC-F43 TaxID=3153602 RepID=UPI0035B86D94